MAQATKQAESSFSLDAKAFYLSIHTPNDVAPRGRESLLISCRDKVSQTFCSTLKINDPLSRSGPLNLTQSQFISLKNEIDKAISSAGKDGKYSASEIAYVQGQYRETLNTAAGFYKVFNASSIWGNDNALESSSKPLLSNAPKSSCPVLYETAVRVAISNFLRSEGFSNPENGGIIPLTEPQYNRMLKEVDIAIVEYFNNTFMPRGFFKASSQIKDDIFNSGEKNTINRMAIDALQLHFHNRLKSIND